MIRDKETLTKSAQVLLYLLQASETFDRVITVPSMYGALTGYRKSNDRRLEYTIRHLEKQGWIKREYREAKKIISLTSKGELEALFEKAKIDKPSKWDGKWRLVMFDIPENARHIRTRLRLLLQSFGFHCLQASVYVYPYALSGAAIELLKKSDLMRYIRIARSDFEDDTQLKKLFKLQRAK